MKVGTPKLIIALPASLIKKNSGRIFRHFHNKKILPNIAYSSKGLKNYVILCKICQKR